MNIEKGNTKGFTLVEIIVVIFVMAILAGFGVYAFGRYNIDNKFTMVCGNMVDNINNRKNDVINGKSYRGEMFVDTDVSNQYIYRDYATKLISESGEPSSVRTYNLKQPDSPETTDEAGAVIQKITGVDKDGNVISSSINDVLIKFSQGTGINTIYANGNVECRDVQIYLEQKKGGKIKIINMGGGYGYASVQ